MISFLLLPPEMARWKSKRFGHRNCINTPPSHKHCNQEHKTMDTHLIIFEMAFGPLWPFTVPNEYICRGAQY